MKKRIIIVGDSFSLGVGADFPAVFDNVNKYAPKIREDWLSDWKTSSAERIAEDLKILNTDKSEDHEVYDRHNSLVMEYNKWVQSVYRTDYSKILKSQNIAVTEETTQPGLMTSRNLLVDYKHTWSNVLADLLPDIEIVNLSKGGSSMSSVLSVLSAYINQTQNDNYDTLVFFHAPDPARKHVISTKSFFPDDTIYHREIDRLINYTRDYNVSSMSKFEINQEQRYDIEEHNFMYVENNLYIGEWYQDIYNAQQICIANNYCFAWSPVAIPLIDIKQNKHDMLPNVLGLDVRLDRIPKQIDEEFVCLYRKHMSLALNNPQVDMSEVYSGCQHFTGKVQELFGMWMAKSLVVNEDWWWRK